MAAHFTHKRKRRLLSFCPLVFLSFFLSPAAFVEKFIRAANSRRSRFQTPQGMYTPPFHHTHDQYHFPVSSFLSRTRYPLRLAHFDRRGSGLGGKFCDDTCYVPIFLTSFTRGMTYAVEYHSFPGRTRGRRLSFTSTGASSSSEQRLACRREIWIVKVGQKIRDSGRRAARVFRLPLPHVEVFSVLWSQL